MSEITIFNRYSGKKEIEKVYGEAAVNLAYDSPISFLISPLIAKRPLSKFYGGMQDSKSSAKKVSPFIKNFSIKIDDYEKGSLSENPIETSYRSFNEFFIRKFKPGLRTFPDQPNLMGAFAEARYYGYESIDKKITIPVKGTYLSATQLLGNVKNADLFEGGPLLLARLCPVDYHRYHYSDNGKTLEAYRIKGDFHSVNPLALKLKEDIFIKNERRISIVDTENFGRMAYIEVGATCVGKIVQSADESLDHKRGDEKGYFLFGGSTVIVLGEPGKWKPTQDLLDHTHQGMETYIHLGDTVAQKL